MFKVLMNFIHLDVVFTYFNIITGSLKGIRRHTNKSLETTFRSDFVVERLICKQM